MISMKSMLRNKWGCRLGGFALLGWVIFLFLVRTRNFGLVVVVVVVVVVSCLSWFMYEVDGAVPKGAMSSADLGKKNNTPESISCQLYFFAILFSSRLTRV